MLPLGGLGMALFTAWRMNQRLRQEEFLSGSRLRGFYQSWLFLLKYPGSCRHPADFPERRGSTLSHRARLQRTLT